jgi:hypothetical protein
MIVLSVILWNKANDNILLQQVKKATDLKKSKVNLEDIQTLDDEVIITYKGHRMHISYDISSDGYADLSLSDDKGLDILRKYNPEKNRFIILDERFKGIAIGPALFDNYICFVVRIDEHNWFFTNQYLDNSYYYINRFGNFDKIIEAPSAIFTGYEQYASGRGYIWSRSFPLLKKYFFIGSGADTYTIAFPQQDYVNLYNYGYADQLLTKPHNMYLQMGVQTGVLSLIAFLSFYAMYFISSIKLYIKGRFKSLYARLGAAILISTFSYMVVGITNDSSITVAPLFWALIGLGIVVNKLARPLIGEEAAGK